MTDENFIKDFGPAVADDLQKVFGDVNENMTFIVILSREDDDGGGWTSVLYNNHKEVQTVIEDLKDAIDELNEKVVGGN